MKRERRPIITCHECGRQIEVVVAKGELEIACPGCGRVLIPARKTVRRILLEGKR